MFCVCTFIYNGVYIYAQQQDSGVTGAKNTAESSTALPTMPQSEEATVVPGSDVKTIQTSEPVPENGTYTISSVPIHVVLDDLLPMEMTAIENEMLATNQAPSPEDNVARDGADPYDQVRVYCSNVAVIHVYV